MSDPGIYGATKTSWRKANPRSILKEIIDDTGATGKELLDLFWERVHRDDDIMMVVTGYYVANNERSLLMGSEPEPESNKAEREKETRERRAVGKAKMVSKIASIVMHNGKALRDQTGLELRLLGDSCQALQVGIADNQRLGDIRSDATPLCEG